MEMKAILPHGLLHPKYFEIGTILPFRFFQVGSLNFLCRLWPHCYVKIIGQKYQNISFKKQADITKCFTDGSPQLKLNELSEIFMDNKCMKRT